MNERLRNIRFTVPGEPKGKERPRYSNKSKTMYTPTATKNYEKLIALTYKTAYGNRSFERGEPLKISIWAFFGIPASDSAAKAMDKIRGKIRPTKKPDWDNIGKIVADALNGIAYHDDAQIVEARTWKYYSDTPRLEIMIRTADEEE
jgi:Holliday junction resolvase RusA-like endonuclease